MLVSLTANRAWVCAFVNSGDHPGRVCLLPQGDLMAGERQFAATPPCEIAECVCVCEVSYMESERAFRGSHTLS